MTTLRLLALSLTLASGLLAAEPAWLVAGRDLGPDTQAEIVAAFTSTLGAQALPRLGESWRQPPPNTPRDRFLSMVGTAFEEQGDLMAFHFNEQGRVQLAVHIGHQKFLRYGVKVWGNPAPELAQGILTLRQRPRPATPELAITVTEWRDAAEKAPDLRQGSGAMHSVVTTTADKLLPVLEPMLFCAAWEAGFTPYAGEGPAKLRIEVRPMHKGAGFRLHLAGHGPPRTLNWEYLHESQYYEWFSRMMQVLRQGPLLADVTRFGGSGVTPLLVTPGQLIVQAGGNLEGWDLESGARQWPPPPAENARPIPDAWHALRWDAAGEPRLLRWQPNLALVAPETGQELAAGPPAPSQYWGYDLLPEHGLVGARGGELLAFRAGKQVWKHSEPQALTAGPLTMGERVLVGTAGGELLALQATDGKLLWRVTQADELRGPLVALPGDLVAALAPTAELLLVAAVTDGAKRWSLPLGDLWLAPPKVQGDSLVLATKANRLLRVKLADGAILAERRWPVWLTELAALKVGQQDALLLSDIAGQLTVLDPKTLAPKRTLTLGRRILPGLLAAPSFPRHFPQHLPDAGGDDDDLDTAVISRAGAERAPAVLAADGQGFLFVLDWATLLQEAP